MKYLRYLKYLLKHKFFVMIECFKEGMIIEGIMNDFSKFSPLEFQAYANHFCGENRNVYKYVSRNGYSKDDDPIKDVEFDKAWVHHIHHNPHHWQHWVIPENGSKEVILEMPRKYMVEMVCDWVAAGKAQGRYRHQLKDWYDEHKEDIILAPYTRKWVENKIKNF
jgi:hypothetical protein